MTEAMTDDERDFLHYHEGGLDAILGHGDSPKAEAAEAVAIVLDALAERFPSRTERLLALAQLARQTRDARDALLREVIASFYPLWPQTYDERYLASLTGLSQSTIQRRVREVMADTRRTAQDEGATT